MSAGERRGFSEDRACSLSYIMNPIYTRVLFYVGQFFHRIVFFRCLASSIMVNVGRPVKLKTFIIKMAKVMLVGMALGKIGRIKLMNCCKSG